MRNGNKTAIFNLKIFSAIFLVSVAAAYIISRYISYKLFLYDVGIKTVFPVKKNLSIHKKNGIGAYGGVIKDDIFGLKIDGGLLTYNTSSAFVPLSVKLIGTVRGGLNYGFFLNGNKIIFMKRGDFVLPGYMLQKVGRKSVVISYGGRLTTLKIVEGSVSGASGGPAGINTAGSFISPGASAAENSIIKKIGENSYIIRKSGIKRLNLSVVYTQMHAVPDIVDGKITGYKVLNVVPGSVFWDMGIRRMDVIKDVNGVPLKSPAEAIGLLTGLQNENSLSLNIQRGGSRITLNYKIE
ncbi:MAG: hypothetical protein M0Z72_02660 [Deltaproteobacteria bacterium]|nr:hypothetical protein [Deltaproteobacteria bacterium]